MVAYVHPCCWTVSQFMNTSRCVYPFLFWEDIWVVSTLGPVRNRAAVNTTHAAPGGHVACLCVQRLGASNARPLLTSTVWGRQKMRSGTRKGNQHTRRLCPRSHPGNVSSIEDTRRGVTQTLRRPAPPPRAELRVLAGGAGWGWGVPYHVTQEKMPLTASSGTKDSKGPGISLRWVGRETLTVSPNAERYVGNTCNVPISTEPRCIKCH